METKAEEQPEGKQENQPGTPGTHCQNPAGKPKKEKAIQTNRTAIDPPRQRESRQQKDGCTRPNRAKTKGERAPPKGVVGTGHKKARSDPNATRQETGKAHGSSETAASTTQDEDTQ